ncbi:hypothetical protein ACFPTX_15940 [Pseudomonas sp. GCM10022188]|uniref:hypothetical protein n=1 Tax=Pseudomonas TaxID=286 RepID=UPI001E64CA37|nr:hypothetical protein [Pseudomonas oryzagri]MCC6076017.1 hypothetical protein [Pseudomonas oryzagri]
MIRCFPLLLPFLLAAQACASQFELVVQCRPQDGNQAIRLLRSQLQLDSYQYWIAHDGNIFPVFEDKTSSLGFDMQVHCSGGDVPLMVFSGQFTANALQGAAIGLDPASGTLNRIDFAERNRPHWIALDGFRLSVIFENSGQESASRYLIYRSDGLVDEVDEFPSTKLFDLRREVTPNVDAR